MRPIWKLFWIVTLVLILIGGMGKVIRMQSAHLREDVSREATLVQAYEYGKNCGHKGRDTCSSWKGRFLVEPEHVYINLDIDGFFYHRYVDKGRVDMPSYVMVRKVDLGAVEPTSAKVGFWMTAVGFILGMAWFFGAGFMFLLEDEYRK